ncbi:MAG TPA: hypothetical protein VEK38_04255, partial [Candidatus Bathyarchaeia archaeon]|nr:hypothetical protein [Candidatus Bathyarchaeia archaeon]
YNTGTGNVWTVCSQKAYLFSMPLLGLLMMVIVCAGLILCIVPGVIWFVRFSFAPQVLIDKQCSPLEALRISYAMTKNNFWELWAYNFIWFALATSFLFLPIMIMATMHLYYQLK